MSNVIIYVGNVIENIVKDKAGDVCEMFYGQAPVYERIGLILRMY